MDKAFVVFRVIEKQVRSNATAFKRIANALMELVKTVRVLVKNKVSTSLKIQGFYYVANTPDFTRKVLTKPTLSIVRCTKEKNKHPLKFNLF